jgi:hypothetical protein
VREAMGPPPGLRDAPKARRLASVIGLS